MCGPGTGFLPLLQTRCFLVGVLLTFPSDTPSFNLKYKPSRNHHVHSNKELIAE
jgi:hypothetical protein